MAFISDKFVPSGTYVITNAKHQLSIICSEEKDTDDNLNDFKWRITLLAQKKWTIQSHSKEFSANMPPDPKKEDKIETKPGQDQPHQWVIKQRQPASETYLIYSPKQTGLFWSLQNPNEGSTPQLVPNSADDSCWWKFSKVEEPTGTESHPNPLTVTRPTLHDPSNLKHRVAITIPPGWLTTISAVSVGQCLNLVRVQHQVQGILESSEFIGPRELVDQPMLVDGSGANSYTIQTVDEATVLVLEFFHSRNIHRRDPLDLPGEGDVSRNLQVSSVSRPNDKKNFPDYQTFWIFDKAPMSETGFNAIVTVQFSAKVTVDLYNPGKPAPGSVKDGYDENLDRPRPGYMDEYLDKYKIIFIIDDSGSMSGGKWKEVRTALAQIGNEAMQYDADGVEICFINSPLHREFVNTQAGMLSVCDQVRPGGATPTGAKLERILGRIIEKLDDAVDTPAYGRIKPMDIIVVTDGIPTDDPASVIQAAAQKLDEGLHHPNAVGIQFVQIGDEEGADDALVALCNGPVRGMVDTVPYVKPLTPEKLKRVLLGALHPSIRARL